MRAWALIAIGLVVAVAALAGPPLIQMQNDLRAARARNTELEDVVAKLKIELDEANESRAELQGRLEEAKSENEKRQSEIEQLGTELQKAKDAKATNQEGDSGSEPSDAWRPQ
jgi:septal ring factor EnvC (AmiA/AmiB activator)